jgi:hypothetical protein
MSNEYINGLQYTDHREEGEVGEGRVFDTKSIGELLSTDNLLLPAAKHSTPYQSEVQKTYGPCERNIITKGYDPYLPIHKSETRSERTKALAGYCVEVQREKKDWPGTYEWEVAGTVGPNYMLVPNQEVREIAHEIADRSPWPFKETLTKFDGKKLTLCLEAEMEEPIEVSVGDALSFGLMFQNSYDGTGAFKAQVYVSRLVCTNGMMSKSFFASHRFRHTQSSEGWQDDVKAALSMLERAPESVREFARRMAQLRDMEVDQTFLRELRAKGGPARS